MARKTLALALSLAGLAGTAMAQAPDLHCAGTQLRLAHWLEPARTEASYDRMAAPRMQPCALTLVSLEPEGMNRMRAKFDASGCPDAQKRPGVAGPKPIISINTTLQAAGPAAIWAPYVGTEAPGLCLVSNELMARMIQKRHEAAK